MLDHLDQGFSTFFPSSIPGSLNNQPESPR